MRLVKLSVMRIIVQKFGGTSVDGAERIRNVARRVVAAKRAGYEVCVVVSAPGDMTDRLVDMAYEITESPPPREMDMLLSTGERISIALLSMAVQALGERATSFTGSQAGIITDTSHTKARIVEIKADRVLETLEKGCIAIVAGFQGVSTARDVTTLGRGGSDTTAVALAARLGAEVCEIYTDVEGVYTTDPRIVPEARKLPVVSYEEMLEMAATGAKVLNARSVEFARVYRVPVHVRSSFVPDEGTWVREVDEMEQPVITAVTYDRSEAKVTLRRVPDRPGVAARVFGRIAEENVNIDMIIQNISEDGSTDISFTVSKDEVERARQVTEAISRELGAKGVEVDPGIAKVSLIGAGMRTHPGVAAKMFEALAREGINIEMISTSPIKISCVIREERTEDAVRAVHSAFQLDSAQAYEEREI